MTDILVHLHPVLAAAALVFYLILGVRLLRSSKEQLTPGETVLAQAARISMLLIYLSGLVLSYNLHLHVASGHHIASLLPVAVLFGFQFLPGLFNRQISLKAAGWMFLCLFFAFLIISGTAFLPHP